MSLIVIFINNKELNLEFYRLDDFYYGEIKTLLFSFALCMTCMAAMRKTAVGTYKREFWDKRIPSPVLSGVIFITSEMTQVVENLDIREILLSL